MSDHQVFDHVSGTLSALDQEVVRHVPSGGNWRDLPNDFPSARVRQIRNSAARGEGSRSTYYGRLDWARPSYTISTYITRPGNGAFIHPELPRLITVREAARLQSFPDHVRFHGTLRQRCMQVGNAVPPLVAYRLGTTMPVSTVVDLFAGAGGVGLGLGWAGHRVIASVDNNPDACRTVASLHGPSHLTLQRDLSEDADVADVVTSVRARLSGEQLGLLTGGPPCQGFSTAGPCRVDDPRNGLVLSFLKIVEQLRPAEVLF
jgi:DNA (cytosine-5)-methyltransferase 1